MGMIGATNSFDGNLPTTQVHQKRYILHYKSITFG